MIILPLGLSVHEPGIADAINKALKNGIICLAAVGNQGTNARIAFPARMPGVVGIHSCDGYGNPSHFNPSPTKGQNNFCTLGEQIRVRYRAPLRCDDDEKEETEEEGPRLVSGSSYAVVIAASIIAQVFVFARDTLKLEPQSIQALRSPEGVHALLELMSTSRNGYDYVAPWILLSEEFWGDRSVDSEVGREALVKGQTIAALRRIR